MISVHQIITLFVLNFAFGGLQSFQNSDFLKTVRLCLEKPTSTKWVYNVKMVTLQSTKKIDPTRLYKRTSNPKCGPNPRFVHRNDGLEPLPVWVLTLQILRALLSPWGTRWAGPLGSCYPKVVPDIEYLCLLMCSDPYPRFARTPYDEWSLANAS